MLFRLVVIHSLIGAKTSRLNLKAPLDLCATLKIKLIQPYGIRAVALKDVVNEKFLKRI